MSSATQTLTVRGHTVAWMPLAGTPADPPVILIHGIGETLTFWIPDLFEPYIGLGNLKALSLPGHYPAAFARGFRRGDLTPEFIADLLLEAIQQIAGDQPATLVGHSTGGFAALAMAARAPERVRRVISIGGFAQGHWTGLVGFGQAVARQPVVGGALFRLMMGLGRMYAAVSKPDWTTLLGAHQPIDGYPHLEELITATQFNFSHMDFRSLAMWYQIMPHTDITDWLPRITAPTLVIHGSADPIVPPEQAEKIANAIPGATLEYLDGVGHFPFGEAPESLKRIVHDWLAEPVASQP